MTHIRRLSRVYTPAEHPGFLGKGHTARPVIALPFAESDPFIMLMDDILEKKDSVPVGGPHPHAGFETVSLVLEGQIGEGNDTLGAGDFEMMTAGSGVVHTETISHPTTMRLLQLWLNLPKDKRNATPRVQRLTSSQVPTVTSDGVRVKVYSGSTGGVTSPVKNHAPVIIADVSLEATTLTFLEIPSYYRTFLYVISGAVRVGEEKKLLTQNQVGWLDIVEAKESSVLVLEAAEHGTNFVLYAGEPQGHPIVSHGPFIADTMEDIKQYYSDFRAGRMGHITDVPADQKLIFS